VGRAGRDGAPAWGLLLVSPGDMPRRRRLLESDAPGEAVLAHKWGLFLELMRWAEGGSCRHDAILRYFGDEAETLDGCGQCDVCAMLEEATIAEDVTLIVRKALSAVARVHRRFGLQAAVNLLRGEADPRLERAGLEKTTTFGALREHSESWLQRVLRRCVTAGWVDFTADERPVVLLTEAGRAVMKAERPARLLLPSLTSAAPASGSRPRREASGRRGAAAPIALDRASSTVFEALRAHRLSISRAQGVPPYVVASDRTLRDMATLQPRSLGELMSVHGIGAVKADRYGCRARWMRFVRARISGITSRAPEGKLPSMSPTWAWAPATGPSSSAAVRASRDSLMAILPLGSQSWRRRA
jgi:ATP-dependent DNA helicase RecQ